LHNDAAVEVDALQVRWWLLRRERGGEGSGEKRVLLVCLVWIEESSDLHDVGFFVSISFLLIKQEKKWQNIQIATSLLLSRSFLSYWRMLSSKGHVSSRCCLHNLTTVRLGMNFCGNRPLSSVL
jgi:hypothetical protein